MARYKGNANIGQTYDPTYYAPLDTRQLVYTYADLLLESNWIPSGKTSMNDSNIFNGMIVSVGSDSDSSKNGIYRLFDPDHPGKDDIPDVTKPTSWHRMIEFKDLQIYLNSLGGYLIVKTIGERDSLSPDNLIEGTEVYVVDLDVSYRWRWNTWVQIPTGGNGGGNVNVATKDLAGIVMVGTHLTVDAAGKISVDVINQVVEGESRPVSSAAVYDYVDGKIGDIDTVLSRI